MTIQLPQPPSFQGAPTSGEESIWWKRRGPLGWWLAVSAPPRPRDMSSLKMREFVRKAEMISVSILGFFVFICLLISNSLSDPSTAQATVALTVAFIFAILFNRFGKIYIAAYITLISMLLVFALAIVEAKGGLRLIWFTTYDLFVVPVFFSALTIHRRAAPIIALLASAFIILDYTFQPHALITSPLGAHAFDELAYEVHQPFFGWWQLINRNVLLVLLSGFFGWGASLSFEKALAWAEGARHETAVAYAIVDYQDQLAGDLSQFLNELIDAFVAQANGQTKLLRQRPVNDPFYKAALVLNERLRRFEQLQRQQKIWHSNQIMQAIQTLAQLVQQIGDGALGVRALETFHSQIEPVDTLAQLLYAALRPRYTYNPTPFPSNTPPPPLSF